jgi:hypothetical protein
MVCDALCAAFIIDVYGRDQLLLGLVYISISVDNFGAAARPGSFFNWNTSKPMNLTLLFCLLAEDISERYCNHVADYIGGPNHG